MGETRYFKLSTHSLSIYINDKILTTESVIKLSSMLSINRNTKNDGADLKDNRFDIHLKNKTVNLRTENDVVCKQWIHFISQQRKQHKKSIRTGLEDVYSSRFRSKGTIEYEPSLSVSTKHKSIKKASVNRFKRRKTSRSELQREAVSIHSDKDPEIDADDAKNEETQKLKSEENKNLISKPAEFEGFLLRKIGHSTEQIAQKIYFRLICDQLEFSKIDEMIDENDEDALNEMHGSNILGSISIEHIKSVQMASSDDSDEFVLVFNDHNPNSDWILKTTKSDRGNAQKWIDVLQRAQNEAVQIVKIINNTKIEQDDEKEQSDDDDDESDTDSDDDFGTNKKRKKKKKIGGSIKALQKMINDESILELETARNNDLNSKHLVNGFEINSLQNENEDEHMLKSAENAQACSCCLIM